jgi:hypothetical protein
MGEGVTLTRRKEWTVLYIVSRDGPRPGQGTWQQASEETLTDTSEHKHRTARKHKGTLQPLEDNFEREVCNGDKVAVVPRTVWW